MLNKLRLQNRARFISDERTVINRNKRPQKCRAPDCSTQRPDQHGDWILHKQLAFKEQRRYKMQCSIKRNLGSMGDGQYLV